jgi:penicillin G amidase
MNRLGIAPAAARQARSMRTLAYIGAAAVLLVLMALCAAYGLLRASLPQLDGRRAERGLGAVVRITRDARGVPTIEAANRLDLAFGTGFVHAQDRFFQMDLARRHAAGELSELFGRKTLEEDRRTRLFRFRSLARQVFAAATPEQRAVVEAYARGVNAGLASLGSRPWEYWLLGAAPARWQPEDTVLVEYSMWWDLQASGFRREIVRREINARLGGPACAAGWKCGLAFLYPVGTSWDAPDGPATAVGGAPVPDPDVLNVRDNAPFPDSPAPALRTPAAGSNNWAVAGRLTASGAALVANDMHLGLRVPPVWYQARLETAPRGASSRGLDLSGVTLPGTPLLVAGSNGRIAWGFTNSYGTWLDVESVPCVAVAGQERVTPEGRAPLAVTREQIRVRGETPVVLEVVSGPAGVLLRADPIQHDCWFGSWLAQLPAATNLNLMELEQANSVAEAFALAPQIGIPHQNAVVGDAQGHIGWTIFGRIPEDTGPQRARRGAPWTTSADHPQIVDPPLGRIWTANARVTSDEQQQALIGGDAASLGAEYNLGARAAQIRDDLLALAGPMRPTDMLRIQLDDRAVFLGRWRTLVLSVLDAQSLRNHPQRAEFRRLVESWKAQASVDSVGYRLVRAYHDRTQRSVWDMLLGALRIRTEDAGPPEQFEGPLWQLVTTRPLHLLARNYAGWPEFLRAQVDATIADLQRSCRSLARCTWGARNTIRIRHPLSAALPWLAALLDMPTAELPGDHDMPRVQDGIMFGASERFAVSPGHESEGYLHIAGGQSGHPLSPYYRSGFLEWARGEPLPFLPGAAEHTLTLSPD